MSHVTCCADFVGSQTFHSSHIHSRVHIRACIASHDMIGCGVMWNSIQLHSSGIHVHMGLMFSLSHGFT